MPAAQLKAHILATCSRAALAPVPPAADRDWIPPAQPGGTVQRHSGEAAVCSAAAGHAAARGRGPLGGGQALQRLQPVGHIGPGEQGVWAPCAAPLYGIWQFHQI